MFGRLMRMLLISLERLSMALSSSFIFSGKLDASRRRSLQSRPAFRASLISRAMLFRLCRSLSISTFRALDCLSFARRSSTIQVSPSLPSCEGLP